MAAALLAGGCAASAALSRGPRLRTAPGIRRRRRRIHPGSPPSSPTTPKRGSRSIARSCAPPWTTFSAAGASPPTGKYEQALVEYEAAAELNPSSGDIDTAVRETRNKLRSKIAVSREGKTELQTLIDRTRTLPAPGLDLPADAKMPASLFFRGASSRLVFMAIGKIADISVGFDPAFREAPVTVDLRNTTLRDALNAVSDQTRTFYRVTAPRTVLDHSRHAGQAPRVRGRSRPRLLSEQRRPEGDDGPAADGARRPPHLAGDRHQCADGQGHARAGRRRGTPARGDRQGAGPR